MIQLKNAPSFFVLFTICVALLLGQHAAYARSNGALPAVQYLLLDNADPIAPDTPPIVHPEAGLHLPFALQNGADDMPFGYYRSLPPDFTLDPRRQSPLIVFLHGLGEVGDGVDDLDQVRVNGPPKMIDDGIDFPAIVVSPQATTNSWQTQFGETDIPGDLHTLVNYFKTHFNVDPDRIYITGLSLGGGGAWNYARLYHEEVAAVVPICGVGINGPDINQLANMGVWAFHAIGDGVVSSLNTVQQMNRIAGTTGESPNGVMYNYPNDGAEHVVSRVDNDWVWQEGRYSGTGATRYTVFPDGSHNSWARAYNQNGGLNTPMWEWLFQQRRHAAELQ